MIFLVQFGINKHFYIFQRPQNALALRACALLLVFEKFTRAYSFQIALEIMWLPILKPLNKWFTKYFAYIICIFFLHWCFSSGMTLKIVAF